MFKWTNFAGWFFWSIGMILEELHIDDIVRYIPRGFDMLVLGVASQALSCTLQFAFMMTIDFEVSFMPDDHDNVSPECDLLLIPPICL